MSMGQSINMFITRGQTHYFHHKCCLLVVICPLNIVQTLLNEGLSFPLTIWSVVKDQGQLSGKCFCGDNF